MQTHGVGWKIQQVVAPVIFLRKMIQMCRVSIRGALCVAAQSYLLNPVLTHVFGVQLCLWTLHSSQTSFDITPLARGQCAVYMLVLQM